MGALLRPTENWPAPAQGGTFMADRGAGYTQGPRYHQGVDVPYTVGTPLYASEVGTVAAVGDTGTSWGYGRYVKVQYGIFAVLLAHCSQVSVKVGQNVWPNTLLGYSGGGKGAPGAGSSNGPHTHIELTQSGAIIDPANLSPRGTFAGGNTTPLEDDMSAEDTALLKEIKNLLVVQGQGYGYPQVAAQGVADIQARLAVTGQGYDWLPALNNKLTAIAEQITALNIGATDVAPVLAAIEALKFPTALENGQAARNAIVKA